MPIFIFQLPRELFTIILDHIPERDLFRLSATCQAYRNELAPRLFRVIHFSNDAKSANSALRAAKRFGHLTVELMFEYQGGGDNDCVQLLALPVLLPATQALLRGFDLPELKTIQLIFGTQSNKGAAWKDQLLDLLATTEHPAETTDAEEKHEWRALLNETYAAISENLTISRLILDEFLPINVSALYSRGFRRLLGRLPSAEIRLCTPIRYGGHNEIFSLHGYKSFVTKLSKVLLDHMQKVELLYLDAACCIPLGGVRPTSTQLALPPKSLPLLTTLCLANCFLSSTLLEFIGAHTDTLSCVDLQDCAADFSGANGDLEQPLPQETWANFFSEILKLQSTVLVEFTVDYTNSDLLELFDSGEPTEFGNLGYEAAQIAAESLASSLMADPSRKFFSYATLDPEYGDLIIRRYVNRIQAARYRDQVMYQKLQVLVKRNADQKLRQSPGAATT
ncbi:hypothetical protein NLG97_g8403 [Lecanicillium saksenae]|uniref:Uncharacterized protein n=1 Tax=Lecanicillium saksenae TaxID=468837 RepID=A0ACC1QLN9_9HYPO|nr:hypothetical protein NLG97_g8403 [Lecanicillium saksenae]